MKLTSGGPGPAFLLAQVGAAASIRFAEAIGDLGLTPPQAGLLRQIATGPRSQQDLARQLGTAPSRIVSYLDDLEDRQLVQRTPGADRRVNLVSLTPTGIELLKRLGTLARRHDSTITAALTGEQRRTLTELLAALAADLQLTPGVHPGYQQSAAGGASAGE